VKLPLPLPSDANVTYSWNVISFPIRLHDVVFLHIGDSAFTLATGRALKEERFCITQLLKVFRLASEQT
jgi:hypothetical protein